MASNADTQVLEADKTYTDSSNNKYQYTLNTDGTTATLTKFTGTVANVPERIEIEKDGPSYTVTAIGKEAFATPDGDSYKKNTQLQSVNLPNTIKEIGDYAFYYCTNDNFTSIKIPDDVTEIKTGTFGYCTSLNSVTLPKHLTTIGVDAFSGCSALTSITLSEAKDSTAIGIILSEAKDLTTIGHGAFTYCAKLSKAILPEGLTTVGSGAFLGADLKTIDWPESLTTVGDGAFHNKYNSDPIKIITYHGTETDWQRLLNRYTDGGYTVAATNPQLVPKNTENAEGVDLHCAHTVTFNANGHGTAPGEQKVQYEGCAEKPSDPEEKGYTFKGWFTTPNGDEAFDFDTTKITKDETVYAHWEEEEKKPDTQKPDQTTPSQKPDNNKPDTQEKPNEPTPPEAPAVEEDDTAVIGYAAAAVTAAFVGWGAYRIGSEVYLKYLLPKDVLLPQNRIQLAELLWEDAGRPAPADAAAYTDVDDTDAQQAARWAVENGLLTLPDAEKPEEFAPYRSVSYAKSARAWNKAQQLKENAAR